MLGQNPEVAVHRLAIQDIVAPAKQAQRKYQPKMLQKIEGKIDKLIVAGFIREVKYPTWVSSIVPVKKNGQTRV